MYKLVFKFSLLLLLCSSISVFAQKDSLYLGFKYTPKQKLQLKWQFDNLALLPQVLKTGFNIYKAPVSVTNGKEVLGGYQKINASAILPWSLEKAKQEEPKDSLLQIVPGFYEYLNEIAKRPKTNNLEEIMEHDSDDGNFSLIYTLAMIRSNKLAEAMGMYFEDPTPMATQKYLYKLEVVGLPSYDSYTLVDISKEGTKEPLLSFTAYLAPKVVTLRWFNNQHKDYYGYNVYRSNSKSSGFVKINDIPFINQGSELSKDKDFSFYTDSITAYNQTFYYKVMGLDAFGSEGGGTSVVEIKTLRLLEVGTAFFEANELPNGDVDLKWMYTQDEQAYIKKVDLYRGNSPSGPFIKLNLKPINNQTISYIDKTALTSSNYYAAFAYGYNGDSVRSMIKAVIKIDSIPPAAPAFKKITCDTNGIVKITWQNNKEIDLKGYRLFKTYDTSIEALRINIELLADTVLIDTLDLALPRNKIYYRMYALDQHYNSSMPCPYYELILPDKNPPVNGYFTESEVRFKGIHIEWVNSPALDLASMYLYRQSELDIEPQVLASFAGDSLLLNSYLDTTAKAQTTYFYFLEAKDQAGLVSTKTAPRKLHMLDNRPDPIITNMQGFANKDNRMIKLTWELNANATSYRIYRAKDGKQLSTYTYIQGNVREFYDKGLEPDTKYTYQLVAYMADGSQSLPSKVLQLKY